MACEFRPVVGCYCFDMLPVWFEHPHDVFCEFPCVLPMCELSHEQHVGVSLQDGEYCAAIAFPDDCVHLEVSEPFPVGLFRPLFDARPVWYDNALSSGRPAAVFEPVAAVLVEVSSVLFVLPYHLVDGLPGNVLALKLEVA